MRLYFLFTGIVFCLLGVNVIITSKIAHRLLGLTVDVSNIKWPLGILCIAVGGVCVWFAIVNKGAAFKTMYYICPKCETPFNAKHVPERLCPNCNEPLEELKDFYRKHPKGDKKST